MPQSVWYVRDCSLFQRLSADQLSRLERVARVREFPRNSTIFLPSDVADGVFLLGQGRVRICSNTADGKQAILAFIDPGEVFGELSLIQGGEREERAEAAIDSTVILLPGDELRQMLEESAPLAFGVTKLIGLRRKRIERRLRNLLFRSNRDRLGHLLLELTEQYGKAIDDGVQLDIKLSHQELASLIGVTRETVTTLLGEMQLEGLLLISRQKVVIRNLRRLSASLDATVPELPQQNGDGSRPTSSPVRPRPARGVTES